jgi:hypothetical protein
MSDGVAVFGYLAKIPSEGDGKKKEIPFSKNTLGPLIRIRISKALREIFTGAL